MRKNSGIIRNKSNNLLQAKSKLQRKKNRFHSINKNDESFQTSTPSSTTENMAMGSSTGSIQFEEHSHKAMYEKAKQKLSEVTEIQKKMMGLSKARLTSFKEKQYERYDESISKLASQATNVRERLMQLLVEADRCMKSMSDIETKNDSDRKLMENMSQSLASQIRQISRALRQQQKQYFDTIRSYQKNAKNTAIELSQQQRQMMTSLQQQMPQQKNDLLNNKKVDQLVKNINKLSTIYKELNSLVIEQGTLVDRIDVNIESTLTHTKQAVVHLVAADEHASSALADRVMKVLVVMIFLLAVVLGLKWAA